MQKKKDDVYSWPAPDENKQLPPTDEMKRQQLVKRIMRNGSINDPKVPSPLVSLEEYFEGNNDYGSICCNLNPMPSPQDVYNVFKTIRERPDVADVVVEVSQLEDPDDWPVAEVIWVLTSRSPADVQAWLGKYYQGDDAFDGFNKAPREEYNVPAGMRAVGIWWD